MDQRRGARCQVSVLKAWCVERGAWGSSNSEVGMRNAELKAGSKVQRSEVHALDHDTPQGDWPSGPEAENKKVDVIIRCLFSADQEHSQILPEAPWMFLRLRRDLVLFLRKYPSF